VSVALITGGASGIGAATARRFRRRGHHVVIADRDPVAGAAVAEEIGGLFVPADVGEPADNARVVAAAAARFWWCSTPGSPAAVAWTTSPSSATAPRCAPTSTASYTASPPACPGYGSKGTARSWSWPASPG
jgi:NAD(P)-dependent dehydrogenase (short-subunit alcohol dehydrogenase family)